MSFAIFESVCKYRKIGYSECCVESTSHWTCRHPVNVPRHCSWGECSEQCCPYFGNNEKEVRDLKIMVDGKVIATVNSAVIKNEP